MTGRAVGSDFLFDGQSPAVAEVVTVFAAESEARASVDAAQAYVSCALAAINNGKLDANGVKFSDAKSAAVSVDAAGDSSHAFQIQATKTYQGQSAPGVAQYTLLFASKGRIVFEISSRGTGEPLDPEEMSAFAQNAAARIRQQ